MTLINAVLQTDLAAATDLLRQGHDVNRKDTTGLTPLMIAAGLGNSRMVELLLAAEADVLVLDDRMGASALHKAAQSGAVDVARLLLERGAFINLQSPTFGHTPLIDAVWHKRAAMVKYLLDQGARTETLTHYGATAMEFAARDNLTDIIRLLEERAQADARRVQTQTLMQAALHRDVEAVKRLILDGAEVDERAPLRGTPNDGYTLLHVAARDGHAEIVRELLQAGANPRLVDGLMKATPGHKAGYQGHAAAARELVAHGGFELDAQGPYNGFTALHDAVWRGHADTVRVFLDAGAQLDLRSHTGQTPLELATEYGYHDIAAMIQKKLETVDRQSPSTN